MVVWSCQPTQASPFTLIDNWWSKPPSHVELGMGYRKQVVT